MKNHDDVISRLAPHSFINPSPPGHTSHTSATRRTDDDEWRPAAVCVLCFHRPATLFVFILFSSLPFSETNPEMLSDSINQVGRVLLSFLLLTVEKGAWRRREKLLIRFSWCWNRFHSLCRFGFCDGARQRPSFHELPRNTSRDQWSMRKTAKWLRFSL